LHTISNIKTAQPHTFLKHYSASSILIRAIGDSKIFREHRLRLSKEKELLLNNNSPVEISFYL